MKKKTTGTKKTTKFVIPAVPPSVNEAYGIGRSKFSGFLYLRSHARDFKQWATSHMPDFTSLKKFRYFKVKYTLVLHASSMFERERTLSKLDISNSIKLLEDAIFEKLGTDDRYVIKVLLEKKWTHNDCGTQSYTKKPYRKKVWNGFMMVCITGTNDLTYESLE